MKIEERYPFSNRYFVYSNTAPHSELMQINIEFIKKTVSCLYVYVNIHAPNQRD